MKTDRAGYQRLAGQLLVLVTIGLGLGTGLYHLISDRKAPRDSETLQALVQPSVSWAPTKVSSNPKPSQVSQKPAVNPQPGFLSIPDRGTSPSAPPTKNSDLHPANLPANVVSTENLSGTPGPPDPPPFSTAVQSEPNLKSVGETPAFPDEGPLHEESGDLIISGKVLTATGEAVSDLEVTGTVNRFFEKDTSRAHSLPSFHARTDQDGTFEFEGLYDGEYTLEAIPPSPYQPVITQVRAGMEEVILVVGEARSRKVQGRVMRRDSGIPLAGVKVAVHNHTTATDENGQYQIGVSLPGPGQGPTVLQFHHPEYQEEQATVPHATQPTDIPMTLNDVTLEAIQGRAQVSGLVETQVGGKPLSNIRVFLSPSKGHGQRDTLTAKDGTFHFFSVPWGTYTLVVVPKTGYQDLTHSKLEVTSAGIEDLHLQLSSLPTTTLRGQFVDPTGQPVRRLTLWLTSRTVRTFTGKPVTSDASGHVLLHDVPAGELELRTRSAPHLTITGLTLKPGSTDLITLPVDWGLQILSGQVVTAGGLPLPGAEITLSWLDAAHGVTSRGIRHSTSDATGTFRFTQLGPGRHTLNVSAPGYTRTLVEHVVSPEHPTVQVTLVPRAS